MLALGDSTRSASPLDAGPDMQSMAVECVPVLAIEDVSISASGGIVVGAPPVAEGDPELPSPGRAVQAGGGPGRLERRGEFTLAQLPRIFRWRTRGIGRDGALASRAGREPELCTSAAVPIGPLSRCGDVFSWTSTLPLHAAPQTRSSPGRPRK